LKIASLENFDMNLTRLAAISILAASLSTLEACDREAGRKQETVGKVESGVGTIVGDKDLKKEGKSDKVTGNVKQGDLKGAVKDARK
jgi:uncharacterized protein YjbJ (UPF0337 family)